MKAHRFTETDRSAKASHEYKTPSSTDISALGSTDFQSRLLSISGMASRQARTPLFSLSEPSLVGAFVAAFVIFALVAACFATQSSEGGSPADMTNNSDRREISPEMPTEPLQSFGLIMLNMGQFGCAFLWFSLQIMVMPSQVRAVAGDSGKGAALGIIVGAGGVITFLLAPLIGKMSDSFDSRTPMMIVGTCGTCLALMLLAAASPEIPPTGELHKPLPSWGAGGYCACYLLLQMSYLVLSVPYHGHLAERTPHGQRGLSSGVNALLTSIGNLVAAGSGLLYRRLGNVFAAMGMYGITLAVSIGAVVLWGPTPGPKEGYSSKKNGVSHPWTRTARNSMPSFADGIRAYMEPFKNHDFFWVFFTRFLFNQGTSTVSWFLEYFLRDVVELNGMSAETAVSMAFLPMLVAAGPSSMLAGWISDRRGGWRKAPVVFATVLMALCALIAAFWARTLPKMCCVMFVFGLGYGVFLAVDFAMVMDVLPSAVDVSRDMAIWHNAMVLPQLLATPVGGAIRDMFHGETGYVALFVVSALYFALSAAFVMRIRGVK